MDLIAETNESSISYRERIEIVKVTHSSKLHWIEIHYFERKIHNLNVQLNFELIQVVQRKKYLDPKFQMARFHKCRCLSSRKWLK